MFSFKKPKNQLEVHTSSSVSGVPSIPDEMWTRCPKCSKTMLSDDLSDNYRICTKCNYYFKLNARERIALICDDETFVEFDKELTSKNLIGFPNYEKKIKDSTLKSAENEAVITGLAKINNLESVLFVMEPNFMMGSMGTVVGEKLTRAFEYATENNLPVIGFTLSGGARMQEGIFSLMQMAKVSGAVKRHSDKGNLYITVLTDPTTGGVTASFAMEGDIILAEPGALIGFAGPRVIEQTIRQKLPAGFQRAEFLLEKGFVDQVVERKDQKEYLSRLLKFHSKNQVASSLK